jgi:hypothetical protein
VKKSIQIIATALAILFGNIGLSQLDSVYIVRGDSVLSVYATTEVDSITFYKPSKTVLSIGDSAHGGIVAYILESSDSGYDANVQHGLIATPTDQGQAEWGCYGIEINGADGTTVGTGKQNNIDIESGCTTSGTAADICANLMYGGYSNWFLPSKDELKKLYLNKDSIGGFTNNLYWSSTDDGHFNAWAHNFNDNSQSKAFKFFNYYYIRAVRAF